MERNYWKDYWDNYYKFVALYLRELQNAYPDADIKNEYLEVASLFEPSMPVIDNDDNDNDNDDYDGDDYNDHDDYDYYYDDYLEKDNNQPSTSPSGVQSATSFTLPGGGQSAEPFISPGGGQFTINNCKKMAIVRIVMRRGFSPSNFFMAVDRADRRSIQGFRIACESGRIRFVPMSVEYRNINLIECAF